MGTGPDSSLQQILQGRIFSWIGGSDVGRLFRSNIVKSADDIDSFERPGLTDEGFKHFIHEI